MFCPRYLLPHSRRFHCQRACHTYDSAVTVQLFSFFPVNSFVDCLAEGMPVRINQRRSPICRPQCGRHWCRPSVSQLPQPPTLTPLSPSLRETSPSVMRTWCWRSEMGRRPRVRRRNAPNKDWAKAQQSGPQGKSDLRVRVIILAHSLYTLCVSGSVSFSCPSGSPRLDNVFATTCSRPSSILPKPPSCSSFSVQPTTGSSTLTHSKHSTHLQNRMGGRTTDPSSHETATLSTENVFVPVTDDFVSSRRMRSISLLVGEPWMSFFTWSACDGEGRLDINQDISTDSAISASPLAVDPQVGLLRLGRGLSLCVRKDSVTCFARGPDSGHVRGWMAVLDPILELRRGALNRACTQSLTETPVTVCRCFLFYNLIAPELMTRRVCEDFM